MQLHRLKVDPGCEVRKAMNDELNFLRIERSQLRWFGHVSRSGPKRNKWSDYIFDLALFGLGMEPAELSEILLTVKYFKYS